MTKQWDKYREVIIAEYKDHNKPLREVQRVMAQRYGFRASTRAYRSRFDRWGIHKYSRRRRESESDGDLRPSPRQSPDVEESSSQGATPVVATPNDLLTPGIGFGAQPVGFRSSLCLVKTNLPYTPTTPSPSPAAVHGPAFALNHLGGGFAPFGSQSMGCYSSNTMPVYRQDIRGVVITGPGASGSGHGMPSMAGIPAGYGYPLELLTGQE